MKTDAVTAFNDWILGNITGQETLWYGKLCSVVLASQLAMQACPIPRPLSGKLRKGDQQRCWCTAYKLDLCGSTILDLLILLNEGLTLPFGYWQHSVFLGHLNMSSGWQAFFAPLRLGLSPLNRVHCLHLQASNLNQGLLGVSSYLPLWWPECKWCLLGMGHR